MKASRLFLMLISLSILDDYLEVLGYLFMSYYYDFRETRSSDSIYASILNN